MFFSIKTGGFYKESIHGKYIPEDAIKISDGERESIYAELSKGKKVSGYENGKFSFSDPVGTSSAEILDSAKVEIRAIREPMLSAVTGIGWEASEAGDAALVQEARNIRNALRDITDDPALNSAKTYEEMRAAGVAAYRRIAAGASPAFAATFKEFTGA